MKAGGEGDNRGWDGWMASSTQWTWVWVNSGSWWCTESLVCCSPWGCKESDRTERLNWTELNWHSVGCSTFSRYAVLFKIRISLSSKTTALASKPCFIWKALKNYRTGMGRVQPRGVTRKGNQFLVLLNLWERYVVTSLGLSLRTLAFSFSMSGLVCPPTTLLTGETQMPHWIWLHSRIVLKEPWLQLYDRSLSYIFMKPV